MNNKEKYLKYKRKYIYLKNQLGGAEPSKSSNILLQNKIVSGPIEEDNIVPCNSEIHKKNANALVLCHGTKKSSLGRMAEQLSESINLVLYSHGEPFNSTKKKLIETINNFTNRNVIIHDYDLNRIKKSSWYNKIKELPKIQLEDGGGRRDGYYNCWKSFIVNEVYENMNDSDILYYVDSSQYYTNGFTESIDKLCDIVLKKGIIAGSVGRDVRNNTLACSNNIDIWNKIIPNNDNREYLNKMHVLNSWFILVKNNINTNFLNDWNYWSIYKDNEFINPLVTYHHTVDQSIFNILVYKYKFKVFYKENIPHNMNKDRNVVLKIINSNINIEQYFINL